MKQMFDGQFPGDAGADFLDPEVADITKTYPALQPEATYALIGAYRTGRPVNFYQDLNGLAAENVNQLNAAIVRNWTPARRQSADMVYANIATIGVDLEGLR